MTTAPNWFDVDKAGLERLLDRRGRHRVLAELPSNAFDEAITRCTIEISWEGRGLHRVEVEDDSVDGFRRLSDAWTLFAPSYKTEIADKRGRFNLGEKLFLSMCESASIETTTGTVIFDMESGRRQLPKKRGRGTVLSALVRMNKTDAEKGVALLRQILPPAGVAYTVNRERVENRSFLCAFEVSLPTEIEGEDGWRSSTRKTRVCVYQPLEGEQAHIYEMGIPVVEYDGRWHIDIQQKIPLNTDRDNVTPSFLKKLHTAVLDNTWDLLRPEDTTATWVKDGLAKASHVALQAVVEKRFGKKTVTYDPSDPQANKEAAAKGYTVIPPRTFDRATWQNIREADLAPAAGRVTPSHSSVKTSIDGVPPMDPSEWTDEMEDLAHYAKFLAEHFGISGLKVEYYNSILIRHAAWYGSNKLAFNVGKLGWNWINSPNQHDVDALLIHEFAHHKVSDHLSHEYYAEICRLGAIIRDFKIFINGMTVRSVSV